MLEFNPYFRMKPEELLKMQLFDPWKAKYPELLVPPQNPIKLLVDKKNAFDYESSLFRALTMKELHAILISEIEIIKQMNWIE